MNDAEKDIVLLLNDVYERYSGLPVQHKDDMPEFVNALHVLQHLVMIRGVRREDSEMFPLNLKAEAKMESLDDAGAIERAISETLNNALSGNLMERSESDG